MTKKLAVIDLETDPFLHDREPVPFVSGFYDGHIFKPIWDDNECITKTVAWLVSLAEPHIIYCHNGGKFDFYYFLHWIKADLRIVNGRIIQAKLGQHELRDSFAIMPFALKQYKKDDINYSKLERNVRNRHRDEILEYLHGDCVYLYELVTAYWQEFGDVLTIGSASMKQFKKFHKFSCGSKEYDEKFRKTFYFGGRVQAFRSGVLHERLSVLDVNSMYPFVMKTFLHPIGTGFEVSKRIERNTAFVIATGYQHNEIKPFLSRGKDKLNYDLRGGTFGCTIHEWQAAEDTNSFHCMKIEKTYGFRDCGCFDTFVDHFYEGRLKAKAINDKVHDLFYKFVLNSCYGKFAQNPENYYEWLITEFEAPPPSDPPWEMEALCMYRYILWKKPLKEFRYYNIATAASITGAARAVLLRGLYQVTGLAYCDTDSIIARTSGKLELNSERLGAWKVEATANHAAIAGRKLYALTDDKGKLVKQASKGNHVDYREIFRVAQDPNYEIVWDNPVPNFKLDGSASFTSRRVRRTC